MDHVYRGEEKDGKIGMQKENSYNFLSETLTDTASVRGMVHLIFNRRVI